MLNRLTQFLAASVVAGTLFVAPAQACRGGAFEHHIILHTMPADAGDVEFIGKVNVRHKRKWMFFPADESEGFLARVTESTTHPALVGTSIEIPPIIGTSCGPWLDGGDSGYMVGIFEDQENGRPLLHPKSFRYMDLFQ